MNYQITWQLPRTLPACITIKSTVVLHDWWVGECWGDVGQETSMLVDVWICNLLLRSFAIGWRNDGENIVSVSVKINYMNQYVWWQKQKKMIIWYYFSVQNKVFSFLITNQTELFGRPNGNTMILWYNYSSLFILFNYMIKIENTKYYPPRCLLVLQEKHHHPLLLEDPKNSI